MTESEQECSRSTYNNKKHGDCDGCRKANSEYVAGQKADHRSRTQTQTVEYHTQGGEGGIPSLSHGKANTHEYLGCNCSDCVEAARERWRTSNQRHRSITRLRKQRERQAHAST